MALAYPVIPTPTIYLHTQLYLLVSKVIGLLCNAKQTEIQMQISRDCHVILYRTFYKISYFSNLLP